VGFFYARHTGIAPALSDKQKSKDHFKQTVIQEWAT
jgi:hypothetical protein